MNARTRSIAIALVLAAGAGGPGCANLVAKKVSLENRALGKDHHVKGFRYYLNRPYLVVKNPVLVYEKKTLVKQNPADKTMTYLEGDQQGQTVKAADLKVAQTDGTLRPVTPEELARLRAAVAPADRDPQVAQTSGDGLSITTPSGATVQATLPAAPQVAAPAAPATPPIREAPQSPVGGPEAAIAAATDTASLTDIDPSSKQQTAFPADASLTGDMAVMYLPDLDEQYVVKSKNFLAKSSFALTFVNGSELTQVQGEHDATTVTLALLDQIQKAIGVASGVEQAQIQKQSTAQSAQQKAGTSGPRGPDGAAVPGVNIFQMVERVSIQPGVYRLNKPWEINQPGIDPPTGLGLLAKLGLPTTKVIYYDPIGTLSGADPAAAPAGK